MYTSILSEIRLSNQSQVGKKAATLGQIKYFSDKLGINVPDGFILSVNAYEDFIAYNMLQDRINVEFRNIDPKNLSDLKKISNNIQNAIINGVFPKIIEDEIYQRYQHFITRAQKISFAVRSSGSYEDLSNASFAGQQDTFLNVRNHKEILHAIKQVYASIYSVRAISYRFAYKFSQLDARMSIIIQEMVRSDLASSGVMFTIDPNTHYRGVININAALGLGESVVAGEVETDEFFVDKDYLTGKHNPIVHQSIGKKDIKYVYDEAGVKKIANKNRQDVALSEQEVIYLAKLGLELENYFGVAQDIEWAKDGLNKKIYIVQTRPIVNQSQNSQYFYKLEKTTQKPILAGVGIGTKIASGPAKVFEHYSDNKVFNQGDILVTDFTDPNWEPLMRKAGAIITNRGSRTCHAAIIAREIGVPAVISTYSATKKLKDNQNFTVDLSQGDRGFVYKGDIKFVKRIVKAPAMPKAKVSWALNLSSFSAACFWHQLPVSGIGLMRMEFIVNQLGVHPRLITENAQDKFKTKIEAKNGFFIESKAMYVEKLAMQILAVSSPFKFKSVTIRLTDFKTNEYASLIGGDLYESKEENPMLGDRGGARYLQPENHDSFLMELDALKILQSYNLCFNVLIPFVRTVKEAEKITAIIKEHGIKQKIFMMCEVPSNVILIEEFLTYFDGVSIGTNDLMQLTLGVDRDSKIANQYSEQDESIIKMLDKVISACKAKNKFVGICGQAPSDNIGFTRWLLDKKIDSISLNPDALYKVFSELNESKPS